MLLPGQSLAVAFYKMCDVIGKEVSGNDVWEDQGEQNSGGMNGTDETGCLVIGIARKRKKKQH